MEEPETKIKKIGLTDMPWTAADEDLLDTKKYAQALKKFVLGCPTPMSIAIQGDWGTGKTSLIHMLREELVPELGYEPDFEPNRNSEPKPKAEPELNSYGLRYVYFNTWQYSQFGMDEDLYMTFVCALIRKCSPAADVAKKVFETAKSLLKRLVSHKVREYTDVEIEDLLTWQKDREKSVEDMKNVFAQLVKAVTVGENGKGDGRLIVCIDDLDRLNPEVAVELLEVIKLFMDVERCVFVLAIDYDVVVNGVRKKYGEDMSEQKCRSFFDKIIQVPFRMPVESYNLENMIRDTVKGMAKDSVKGKDIPLLSEFIGNTLGANPRAYKRLANSFFLLQNVRAEDKGSEEKKLDNVLTFCALCLQMCAPQTYQLLVEAENVQETFASDGWGSLEDKEAECAEAFQGFWEQLAQHYPAKNQMDNAFACVLRMTSITSVVSGEPKKGGRLMKVDQITVNGESFEVATPTDALVKSYQELLMERNGDLVEEYAGMAKSLLTRDKDEDKSRFRSKKELKKSDGTILYIGVSSDTRSKEDQVQKLCKFLKDKNREANVIWEYKGETVFRA